jgi:hypothetical protein
MELLNIKRAKLLILKKIQKIKVIKNKAIKFNLIRDVNLGMKGKWVC